MSEGIMATCASFGCANRATQQLRRGRVSMPVCDEHGDAQMIQPAEFKKPTTGSKEADRMLNRAIDSALLRLRPILRDILRAEIKKNLPLED